MSEAITLQGIVHKSRIEIPAPPGFAEGQAVTITVSPLSESAIHHPMSEAVVKAFGILSTSEGEDLDRYLETSRQWQRLENPEPEL